VAAFDTAFHATLPETRPAVPFRTIGSPVRDPSVRLPWPVVAWSTERAAELLGRAAGELCLVVAHLGRGCSVTAVDGGRSVDTSMG